MRRRKPDLVVALVVIFSVGVVVTSYAQSVITP